MTFHVSVGGRCFPSVLKIMNESGILLNELTQGQLTNAAGAAISTNEIMQNNKYGNAFSLCGYLNDSFASLQGGSHFDESPRSWN